MDDSDPSCAATPPTDLATSARTTGLVERIRDEIRATGPMPFARFMELALYDPDGGYYRVGRRPARAGRRLPDRARAAPDLRRDAAPADRRGLGGASGDPSPFVVREHGAGDGALGRWPSSRTRQRRAASAPAIRYGPVEVERRRLERAPRAAGGGRARRPPRADDRARSSAS